MLSLQEFIQHWQIQAPQSMLRPLLRMAGDTGPTDAKLSFGQILLLALFDLSWGKTVTEERGYLFAGLGEVSSRIIAAGDAVEKAVSENSKLPAWTLRIIHGALFAVDGAGQVADKYWDTVESKYVPVAELPVPVEVRSWNLTCLASHLLSQLKDYASTAQKDAAGPSNIVIP